MGLTVVVVALLCPSGRVAPGFALPNQDGERVDGATLAGTWFVL